MIQSEYSKGMVDAAARIKDRADRWGTIGLSGVFTEINDIIAEHSPKKTQAELFVERYAGKAVKNGNYRDWDGAIVVGETNGFIDVVHPRLGEGAFLLKHITHVQEVSWVPVCMPDTLTSK